MIERVVFACIRLQFCSLVYLFVFIVIYLIYLLLSGNLSAFKRRYGQYWFVVVHLRGKTCGDLSKISLSHAPLSKLIGLVLILVTSRPILKCTCARTCSRKIATAGEKACYQLKLL